MRVTTLDIGFVPLVDAAPLIVAQEMGFAAEEGISLALRRAPSWSSARDALTFGQVNAAHMLAPVPVAMALGLGGVGGARVDVISVLSVNGTVVGINTELAARMHAAGYPFDFADATAAGRALITAVEGPLRIGVPFPFSMHAELVFYWLSSLGYPSPQSLIVRTVPPSLMADAIRAGEIDAFCVGEPWGSKVVESGTGQLLLPGAAIWAHAPEKVLAVRGDWASSEPELSGRLIRAVWRAGRWLDDAGGRSLAAELLARPEYLDINSELIERAMSGHLTISANGETRAVDRFIGFHDGAVSFPWRSQAAWIGGQIAARTGLERGRAMRDAAEVFRSDLHRGALASTGGDLPAASLRVEGALDTDERVPSQRGGDVKLCRDAFFDGARFDPKFT
ncbi:ABC transporter substrate-binding protein [Profundibacterium mesophilum]|uniref:ABC transporter nucleotide bindingATPase protein n=1 Tax=Profundibacterium mesophilum KAUST100406-0324 TaxID=1037889 RepID=A0A921NWX5_9RHOB|nr:ABC transporter substrate-binding protein [Profundibacterium mesophilum]KAF0676856.1 ABC transporter nucleotide bindingATPase protein [Profundibacterium mesophilum KAUST100406-0324]